MKRTIIALLLTNVITICLANEVLNGRVINSLSGHPIANVWIQSDLEKVQSDQDGKFNINVAYFPTELTFHHPKYKTLRKSIAKNTTLTVKLELIKEEKSPVTTDLMLEEDLEILEIADCEEMLPITFQANHKTSNIRIAPPYYSIQDGNSETYKERNENAFQIVQTHPLSTFSIDVDQASYSNVRRYLNNGILPPADAVKTEELINYFTYDYPEPTIGKPFGIYQQLGTCPWNEEHQILMIGLQTTKPDLKKLPNSNFVFLVDVSGSMNSSNKLPLLQQSLKMLVKQLRPTDRVAIVTYAENAGLALPSTAGNESLKINQAIDALHAGGSTAGAAGLELAYQIASENFMAEGNNRIILATDGDFNVGPSSNQDLKQMVENYRNQNIYISVLGYGMDNYKDDRMETIAQNGNGNHYFIDNLQEAKKVLINEMSGTLFTVAKDVKLQVEFNPNTVAAYCLIGYENRMLNDVDFNDDKKDAGEVGAGHTVTALYEIVPIKNGADYNLKVDPLKYQQTKLSKANLNELATLKIRYKAPDGEISKKESYALYNTYSEAPDANYTFACAVAYFGQTLSQSKQIGKVDFIKMKDWAQKGKGTDSYGYRGEFIRLIELSDLLMPGSDLE